MGRSSDERLLEFGLLPGGALEVRRVDPIFVDDARARVPALAAEEVGVEKPSVEDAAELRVRVAGHHRSEREPAGLRELLARVRERPLGAEIFEHACESVRHEAEHEPALGLLGDPPARLDVRDELRPDEPRVAEVDHRLLHAGDHLPLVERERRLVRPVPLLLREASGRRGLAAAALAVLLPVRVPRHAGAVPAPLHGTDEVESFLSLDVRIQVEALAGREVEGDVLAAALEDGEARVLVRAERRAAENARLAGRPKLFGVALLDEIAERDLEANLVLVSLEEGVVRAHLLSGAETPSFRAWRKPRLLSDSRRIA